MISRKKATRKKASGKKAVAGKASPKKAITQKRVKKYASNAPEKAAIEFTPEERVYLDRIADALTDALRRHDREFLDRLTELVKSFEVVVEKYERGYFTLVNAGAVRTVGVTAKVDIVDAEDDEEPLIEKNFED